jgi:hypothetical protein
MECCHGTDWLTHVGWDVEWSVNLEPSEQAGGIDDRLGVRLQDRLDVSRDVLDSLVLVAAGGTEQSSANQ